MKPSTESPLVFSPGLMNRPLAWVLLAVPVPLMVLACVVDSRPGHDGKWLMPIGMAIVAMVAMFWVTRYFFDTRRQVVVRQVGWGPIIWGWTVPLSSVHAVEFGGFTSRYGTAYYTVTLVFGNPARRRRILLDTDGHKASDQVKELAAEIGVPLLGAD